MILVQEIKTEVTENDIQEVQQETDGGTVQDNENVKIPIEEKGDNLDSLQKEMNQDTDESIEQNPYTKEADASSSFSFRNIIKSIVDPMFEETDKKPVEVEEESKIEPTVVNVTTEKNDTSNLEPLVVEQEVNKTDKKMKFKCISRNITLENATSIVKIINNTRLLQMLNFDKNDTLSDCVLVMFYAPWCRFCAKVAPSFNALARAFPDIDIVAVDAAYFSNLNARFGTVSVPNILLFHQSRAVVRFNQTDKQFDNLVSFVKNHTGMEPETAANVTDDDYLGPLPSVPSDETDYLLWISWLFVIVFISVVFVRSSYGQLYINKIKILWQEHQHQE